MPYSNNKGRGVGLKLVGYPSDEEAFFWILAQEGCHPKAVKRILERLKTNGFDLLTVMDGIYFDWVREQLKTISVEMTFIKPLDDWEPLYKDGAWDDKILNEVFERRNHRIKSKL